MSCQWAWAWMRNGWMLHRPWVKTLTLLGTWTQCCSPLQSGALVRQLKQDATVNFRNVVKNNQGLESNNIVFKTFFERRHVFLLVKLLSEWWGASRSLTVFRDLQDVSDEGAVAIKGLGPCEVDSPPLCGTQNCYRVFWSMGQLPVCVCVRKREQERWTKW